MTLPLWLATPILLSVALLAACHALLNKRDSKAAFGWIALIIILPLAGPVIYLLFGINRVHHRAQKDYHIKVSRDSLTTIADPQGTKFRPLSTVGEVLTNKGLSSCNEVTILVDGEGLYPAMLEAIEGARHRILLASYIFDNDRTGDRFVGALADAVKRGVEVKVIIDGLGEFTSIPRIGGKLRRHGIPFVRFNPVRMLPPALNINMRSHRKLLIVDGLTVFTGGQNIGDRHLVQAKKNRKRVQDIHFRLSGKIVDELEWAFWQDWHYCKGKSERETFRGHNVNIPEARTWSRLILDGPNKDFDKLNSLMVGVISAARSRVRIMTPYFLPTLDLISAITAAHLRGVHVTILLPGKNNIRTVHWASQNILRQILEHTIDIRYQPPPFIHSKLLLVDDNYSLIGSANMDPRSLRLNYELGVELFSEDMNRRLADYFDSKAEAASPVTREQILNRSLPTRLRDSLAWLFSPYL